MIAGGACLVTENVLLFCYALSYCTCVMLEFEQSSSVLPCCCPGTECLIVLSVYLRRWCMRVCKCIASTVGVNEFDQFGCQDLVNMQNGCVINEPGRSNPASCCDPEAVRACAGFNNVLNLASACPSKAKTEEYHCCVTLRLMHSTR
jgi:hypothetical protein